MMCDSSQLNSNNFHFVDIILFYYHCEDLWTTLNQIITLHNSLGTTKSEDWKWPDFMDILGWDEVMLVKSSFKTWQTPMLFLLIEDSYNSYFLVYNFCGSSLDVLVCLHILTSVSLLQLWVVCETKIITTLTWQVNSNLTKLTGLKKINGSALFLTRLISSLLYISDWLVWCVESQTYFGNSSLHQFLIFNHQRLSTGIIKTDYCTVFLFYRFTASQEILLLN